MNWRSILNKQTSNNQENKENKEYQGSASSNTPDIPYILGRGEIKNEIKEAAEYLFFERLGISNSEDLALDEAFNHIINKLTIQ